MDTPQDGNSSDNFATIPDVPIPSGNSSIFNPNQVRSGVGRGAPVINYGADGNPQVMQGSQATFGNGFYVAKPGIDVTSATDPANFIFNSNQDVFKIVLSGETSITTTDGSVSGSQTRVTVPHNLGFTPIPLAFINIGNNISPLPTWTILGYDTTFQRLDFGTWIQATTDKTNLYIDGYSATSVSLSHPIKYYLLQETANQIYIDSQYNDTTGIINIFMRFFMCFNGSKLFVMVNE